MKKTIIAGILIIIIAAAAIAAGIYYTNQPPANGDSGDSKLNVITTFYPLYDFAQNVGGDKVSVSILVPETLDVHDFEPTPSSIAALSNADVFIYNGAGLEHWIEDIIQAAENPNLVEVDTSQGINLISVGSEFQNDEGGTIDPHIWLDPLRAKQQVNNILQGLIEADPDNSEYYTQNAQAYQAKLDALHQEAVDATTDTTTRYFVTFHESFAYFADRHDITQIPILGPFEEEPSPSDIQNVINAINQYKLLYVGYESLEDPAISESISSQTNATLIEMNPLEGLTAEEKAAGDDYISIMQRNINNIHLALSNVGS
jgi:zinc transport system substrate-binding protein